MSALKNCQLPTFPDTVSWLPRCSNAGKEIESLRVELENGLIRYLVDSSQMMGLALAIKEAHVMLQKTSGTFSSAYILECPHLNATFGNLGKLRLEDSEPSPYYLNQPTLDEIIEACHSPLMSHRDDTMDDETCVTDDIEGVPHVDRELENGGREMVAAGKETKEADKLSILLEQCNMLQSVIDKKLSIYF
ncbi:hypothetical protein M0R45_001257 [Rubus argutus]|uniref:Uncharacterized protein n=1 Tax=Rubus argutus TaxID=59490 RepID=A0AAW1VKM6_RUBAR